MIVRRIDYGSTLEITAGSNKNFEETVLDSGGNAVDMTDETVYATGKFNILQGDFTLIGSVSITFTDRSNGIITFLIDDTLATNDNAGNWIGEVEFINNLPVTISQRKQNFNILQSNSTS